MGNLDTSKFTIDSVDSLDSKMAYFNNYMAEYVAMSQVAKSSNGILPDYPKEYKLLAFTARHISGQEMLPIIQLPVNPDTFKAAFKKRSDITYTLGGFIINHWHDDVITITASGYIPSLGSRAKILTDSYAAFSQLLNLYKSCGQIASSYSITNEVPSYDEEKLKNSNMASQNNTIEESGNPSTARKDTIVISGIQLRAATVSLRYQQDVYEGIFIDFTMDESYDQPNTLRYSFTFKAMTHKDTVTDKLLSNEVDQTADNVAPPLSTEDEQNQAIDQARATYGAASRGVNTTPNRGTI